MSLVSTSEARISLGRRSNSELSAQKQQKELQMLRMLITWKGEFAAGEEKKYTVIQNWETKC